MQKSMKLTDRYNTFIFDWDGTLNRMDTILRLKNYAKILLRVYGKTTSRARPKRRSINIKGRIEEEEIGSRLFSRLVDVKMLFSKVKMQEGAIGVLDRLRKSRKNIALFTDSDSYIVLKGIGYHNIEDYFDIIVSTKMIKASKPNPLGLLEILRLLGAKKGETLYIGDTLLDYQAAKNAGLAFCGVGGGFDNYETFKRAGVRLAFRTVEELKRNL